MNPPVPPLTTSSSKFSTVSADSIKLYNQTDGIIAGGITSSPGVDLTIQPGLSETGSNPDLKLLGAGDAATTVGGDIDITGGEGIEGGDIDIIGGLASTGEGGHAYVIGGNSTSGNGGSSWLQSGGSTSGTGGTALVRAGAGAIGGNITIQSGQGNAGKSGDVNINAYFGNDGGDINITSGSGIAGTSGDVKLTAATDGIAGNLIFNVNGTTYAWPMTAPTNGQTLTATVPGTIANVDMTWV